MTHPLDGIDHLPAYIGVKSFIRSCGVIQAPGPQDQLPIGMEVYGTNDGGIGAEVVDDVLSFQLRKGGGPTVVFSITVLFLEDTKKWSGKTKNLLPSIQLSCALRRQSREGSVLIRFL